MADILHAVYETWPLWAFLSVLGASLFVEEGIVAHNRRRLVDNPTLW